MKTLADIIDQVRSSIKQFFDDVFRWLIKIGVKHFKGAVVDIYVGECHYVVRRYFPKHNVKDVKTETPGYWDELNKTINTPGFCDDYVVLDDFEKKLP